MYKTREFNPLIGALFLIPPLLASLKFFGEFKLFQINLEENFNYLLFFFLGALLSSTSMGFSIKIPDKRELIKSLIGSFIFALGVLFLNAGNFYVFYFQLAHLSLSGILAFLGIIIGLLIGVKYQTLEIEKRKTQTGFEIRLTKLNFLLPFLTFGLIIILGYKMLFPVLVFSVLGFVFSRFRFCSFIALREFFFYGKGKVLQGIVLSIMLFIATVYLINFFYKESLFGLQNIANVKEPVWWLSFLGGVLIGVSITFLEADGISILWKLGDGWLKSWLAFVFIVIFLKIFTLLKLDKIIFSFYTQPIYLETWLTPIGAILGIIGVLVIIFFIAYYNEKTKKWVKPIL